MKSISQLIHEGQLSEAKEEILEDFELTIEEAFDEIDDADVVMIDEAGRKVVVKVNSKGQRRKKVVCGPGKKFDGTSCVVQKASEKLARKKGLRKASRTKRSKGAGAARRSSKLRNKANKKRKGQGL